MLFMLLYVELCTQCIFVLLTQYCKLLTTVAIMSRGHVPQWNDASVLKFSCFAI